ncbi:hypothetical protein TMES_00315 [Thalassospira mesophila]|uniref:Peptidase C51 domain-containing protein n=2 Tax=Thalassospira mesophila TaxID=1293891 RepID=A0A1Y2L522_9PROT|nr:hypothetical protein TMES_00315 [Thalassospira mesophila]
MRQFAIVCLSLVLAGCFSTANSATGVSVQPDLDRDARDLRVTQVAHVSLPAARLNNFPPTDEFLQCVPYARAVSGIEIYGDAWTWWGKAKNQFKRGHTPVVGSVLAFKKTKRLRYGHVAVVAAILGKRRILVNQANWGSDSRTRGKVHLRQPVEDVSPNNDWSQLRLMNTIGTYGRIYPSHGFIYQPSETAEAN